MFIGIRYRPSVARKLIGGAIEGAIIAGVLTWHHEHDRTKTIFGALIGAIGCAFLTHLFQMYEDYRANRARREAQS